MGLPTRITLPPSGRPVGGLLSAARPIGGDWWRGVKFTSGQCIAPQVVGSCTDGDVTKDFGALSAEATFDAFAVIQALECSTMGRTPLSDFTRASLDVTREFAVAGELLTGAGSGNPSLADATVIGSASATDAVSALACLDQYAATQLSGRMAFIHASPLLGTILLAASAITLSPQGGRYMTAYGNTVIISAGYDGRTPGQTPPAEGDPQFLYATGQVFAEVGMPEMMEAVERGQNTLAAIAEDAAIVVFDPCFNVAISTDVDFCDPQPVS